MPTDQPDQNQTNTQSTPPLAPVSTQTDLPPIPPEFQNVGITPPATASDNKENAQGTAAPPVPEFSNITKSPKKKFGGGKIIATILGILMLVGGVGAGILLTQQQQLFQQKATSFDCGYNSDGTTNNNFCTNSCAYGHSQTGNCVHEGDVCCNLTASSPPPSSGSGGAMCVFDHYDHIQVCTQVDGQWMKCDTNPIGEVGYGPIPDTDPCPEGYDGHGFASTEKKFCLKLAEKCTPSVPAQANCVPDTTCGTSTTNPPTTTTPSSSPAAPYCAAISTYDADWNIITVAERSSLVAGDSGYLCVTGSSTSETFDKARFTINGELQAETTTKRPGSSDICQYYTIPSGITTFTIHGEIHSASGWF